MTTIILTDETIAELIKSGEIEEIYQKAPNPCDIVQRYYTANVSDKSGVTIEKHSLLSSSRLNRIRKNAHKNGYRVSSVEEISFVRNSDEEIEFHGHVEPTPVVGRISFSTPTYSERRFADRLARLHEKSVRRTKNQDGLDVENPGQQYVILADLYKSFVARKGMTIRVNNQAIFSGTKREVISKVKELLKNTPKNQISVFLHETQKIVQF
jgi:hypothetical protein